MKLTLPSGEEKEYSDFSLYEKDFEEEIQKKVDQKKWSMKGQPPEEIELREKIIRLESKFLFSNQKSKFKSGDEEKWNESQERLKSYIKKEQEVQNILSPYVDKILEQYNSQDSLTFKKGRLNYRLLLIEAFGSDEALKDWDNKHLHFGIEIEQCLRNLYHKGTLEKTVQKLVE